MTDPTERHPAGAMIREARIAAGLTQPELAAQAGISASQVSAIESTRTDRATYPAVLDKIAPVLGIDRDDLYAAAGRIPAELTAAMTGNASALKKVRRTLNL